MRLRLRTRVALSFAVLSLVVAGTVSAATYAFASFYLLSQRETYALTRAALDSRAASAYLTTGLAPSDALAQIPSVGTSQPMVQVGDVWYTSGVTVQPDALPPGLLDAARGSGASQRFRVADDAYYVVAIPVEQGTYVEVFPLRDLDRTLTWGGWTLIGITAVATIAGAVIGATTVGRILRPVRRLGVGAQRIAGGEFSTRIDLTGDPDLDPIAESFNDMASAVQVRIARERRFSANVSHELRSPLTSVLGTAELLEAHKEDLPDREAGLVTVLVAQVRRLSHMLLDLLEISRISTDEVPQWETADIAALCRDVVVQRDLDPALVVGDAPDVRTDARRLERIIGNLVDNANLHGGGIVQVLVQREPDAVAIMVDDAGPGVDELDREWMFEPFARGDDTARLEGAGLGLAIVQEQARLLGGAVTVDRSPAGGARFTATLPILPEES